MVKIPKLDDLKKMGSDLIDSAKTVKLGGMVDRLKTGIESINKRTGSEASLGDDPLKQLLQDASATLSELLTAQASQQALIKKMQNQLADISKVAASYQKPIMPTTDTSKSEDVKSDENK